MTLNGCFHSFFTVAFQCLRLLTWKKDLGEVKTLVSEFLLTSACLKCHVVKQMFGS